MHCKLRVLVIGHTYVIRAGREKLYDLSRKGVEVGLLAPNKWKSIGGLFSGKVSPLEYGNGTLCIYKGAVVRSGHIASYAFMPWPIYRALRQFNPDIVHIEQEVYSLVSAQIALVARVMGKMVVVFGWENLDRRIYLTQRIARKITLSLASAIICGNRVGARLVRKWGFQSRIEVMPQLGIDLTLFFPRSRGNSEANLFTIGFVGRLAKEKGVDVLLRALKIVVNEECQVRALICGSGPYKHELMQLAHELHLVGKIKWVDAVLHDQVPEIMSELDALVLPSRTIPGWKEQFGLVLTQAMAMGIPVVGSECGAIPEVIGREDVIFPEEDHRALAAILGRTISSYEWRKELSEYGLARVHERYTSERLAERLMNLYRSLIGV